MIRLLPVFSICSLFLCWTTAVHGQSIDWESTPVFTSVEQAQTAREAGIPIYRIDLTKQRLRTFPEELANWTELREVVLDRNKLTSIDTDLSGWQFLERFSAQSNDLAAFPATVTAWTALRTLELGDNTIDSIPLDIDRLVELRQLSLWSNVIAHYPASLGDLKHLEMLDLQYNDMTLDEQELLKSWLPLSVTTNLSAPCRCEFDE